MINTVIVHDYFTEICLSIFLTWVHGKIDIILCEAKKFKPNNFRYYWNFSINIDFLIVDRYSNTIFKFPQHEPTIFSLICNFDLKINGLFGPIENKYNLSFLITFLSTCTSCSSLTFEKLDYFLNLANVFSFILELLFIHLLIKS